MAILVSALWGGNFVAARLALNTLPPFTLLGLRFCIVAVLLSPFLFKARPAQLRHMLLLSSVLGVGHFSLMFGALKMGLDVSTGVILTQLGVPFSCLLGSILFADKIGRWRSLGMFVSFIGIIIIAGTPKIGGDFLPFAVACSAAGAWAVANITMKRLGEVAIMPLLAWISLLAIPQYGLLVLLFERDASIPSLLAMDVTVWTALLYTILFSTIVAYSLWYNLLARFPVSQVTPYSLLVPVFGLLAAQIAFGEPMTLQFILGGILTLLGVAIIVVRQPRLAMLQEV